jgi:WD40 repeat protein
MKINEKKKTINNKFYFRDFILKIKSFDSYLFEFIVISPSKLTFISGKKEKIQKFIHSKNDFFLNGEYRPIDAKIFAITGKNKKVDLLDLKKNSILKRILAHKGAIYAIDFSKNRTQLITGGDDFIVKLWDISTQQVVFSFENKNNFIRSIYFSPWNNNVCGSSSYDGKIKIHDFRNSKTPVMIFDHKCPVENFKFSKYGKNLISVGGNQIKLWSPFSNQEVLTLKEKKHIIDFEFFSKNSILYGNFKNEIKKFNFLKNRIFTILCFKISILSINSLSIGLIFGFSNGKIHFKKFKKKNFSSFFLNEFLSNSNSNFEILTDKNLSNYFFFPKKKNFLTFKSHYKKSFKKNLKMDNKCIFYLNSKKSLDFYIRNENLKKLISLIFINNKNLILILILKKLYKTKIIFLLIARTNSKKFFFLIKKIFNDFEDWSSSINFLFLLKITQIYFCIFANRINISFLLKIFFFFKKKKNLTKKLLAYKFFKFFF